MQIHLLASTLAHAPAPAKACFRVTASSQAIDSSTVLAPWPRGVDKTTRWWHRRPHCRRHDKAKSVSTKNSSQRRLLDSLHSSCGDREPFSIRSEADTRGADESQTQSRQIVRAVPVLCVAFEH